MELNGEYTARLQWIFAGMRRRVLNLELLPSNGLQRLSGAAGRFRSLRAHSAANSDATRIPCRYAINGAAVKHGVKQTAADEALETDRYGSANTEPTRGASTAAVIPAGNLAEEDVSRFCPVCSQRLESRRCKLICNVCGYYMSCADYC